jgi:Predicted pyridoxal phosphate-dependent enzyme apparently involved in regulation of cell wall biogenesis
MKIPLVDLKAQYILLQKEIDTAIQNVISDCAFIGTSGNKYVKQFQEEFATYLGVPYCIACANGTDSLEIALKALGIGKGDEVIVPALSWISTSEAVSNIGAKPIFVDIEPDYYTIDVSRIEASITSQTKAIIPVHLYGHPADMTSILAIAEKYGLKVLEDCAQAHGAEINGQKVGTFGHAGSFSFFPGKNLGAYGDAGGIVTKDAEVAKMCQMVSQHGQFNRKHHHFIEGRNSRMDGLQAAILSVKLKYLGEWIDKRNNIAAKYTALLNEMVKVPSVRKGYKHAFHLYVVEIEDRDVVKEKLIQSGIEVTIQYPTALPFLEAYLTYGLSKNDFPVAFSKTSRILSLPIYPELTLEQQEYIASQVKTFI